MKCLLTELKLTIYETFEICHYAPTLGGVRTTMSHPATSSHRDLPDDMKASLGITEGLLRISVGIEDADDLIADFTQALKAFD